MLKGIYLWIVGLFCAFCFLSCENSIPSNTSGTSDIGLDNIPSQIDIPTSAGSIKLTRGTYAYTLAKKADLKNKKYVVVQTDTLTFTSEHQSAPEDAYCKFFEAVPADDEAALRGKDQQPGDYVIKTDEDMKKVKQMVSDVEHFNSAKINIGVLPADDSIRDRSKEIMEGSTISVSGIHYKHSEIMKNGQKEPLSHCLATTDVFYLTSLKIE